MAAEKLNKKIFSTLNQSLMFVFIRIPFFLITDYLYSLYINLPFLVHSGTYTEELKSITNNTRASCVFHTNSCAFIKLVKV